MMALKRMRHSAYHAPIHAFGAPDQLVALDTLEKLSDLLPRDGSRCMTGDLSIEGEGGRIKLIKPIDAGTNLEIGIAQGSVDAFIRVTGELSTLRVLMGPTDEQILLIPQDPDSTIDFSRSIALVPGKTVDGVDVDSHDHTGGTMGPAVKAIQVFDQTTEPTIPAGQVAIWHDTTAGNERWWLIYGTPAGNKKVEMS